MLDHRRLRRKIDLLSRNIWLRICDSDRLRGSGLGTGDWSWVEPEAEIERD